MIDDEFDAATDGRSPLPVRPVTRPIGPARRATASASVATPGSGSFRRSEAYLAGQIARAVARGQRVL
jgi:hypothetical protein